nr:MAG TPA: hypothetical protein [Caudoviricetes sp.]
MKEYIGRSWGSALIAKVKEALGGKVDKVTGKGLSTNDLTTELKKGYDGAVTDVANLKKVGAEKNTIVGIKVNGTAQTPDSNRQVDISVPTDSDIAQKIEEYGYQTETQVNQLIAGKGYQTVAQVKSTVEGYGYQTAAQVNTLITGKGYQTSAQVQAAINESLSGITGIDIQVVESLPTTGKKGVIYLVAHTHGDKDNYDEYVWVASKNTYEKIGNTDIDLSGYVQKTDLVELTDKDLATMWAS